MPRVLDLRDVLELVDDRLDNPAFSQEQLVKQRHQPVLHIALESCDHLQSASEEFIKECLLDVSPVAKEFSPELFRQLVDGFAVVDVAGRDAYFQQFALVVCDQMKFELREFDV